MSDLSDPARLPMPGATPKLSEQVAAVLRERVARGQFAPGARLPSEAQRAEEHAAILAAIARRDAHAARKASARHLVNSIKRMARADPELWLGDGEAAAVRSTPTTTPKEDL